MQQETAADVSLYTLKNFKKLDLQRWEATKYKYSVTALCRVGICIFLTALCFYSLQFLIKMSVLATLYCLKTGLLLLF